MMVHVPTVRELYQAGLADVVDVNKKGQPTVFRLTPVGQEMIYEAMRENASNRRLQASI